MGAQRAKEKKKRTRKWEGLNSSNGGFHIIAQGPIVALSVCFCHRPVSYSIDWISFYFNRTFTSSQHLACSTLLGRLSVYSLTSSSESIRTDPNDFSGVKLTTVWSPQTTQISKVNTIAYNTQSRILGVAGIKGENGCVELWELTPDAAADVDSNKG